jgi:outer membrane lipoprotein-sorting protein
MTQIIRMLPLLFVASILIAHEAVSTAQEPSKSASEPKPAAPKDAGAKDAAAPASKEAEASSSKDGGASSTKNSAAKDVASPAAPSQGQATNEPPTEAEKIIDEAVARLHKIQSVSADIIEKVDMLGQSFELRGEYLLASDHRTRLELKLTGLGDTKGTLLQVSDGKTIWDFQQIVDTITNKPLAQSYRKHDLAPLLEKLDDAEYSPSDRAEIRLKLGFDGPESLLVGLRKMIRFDQKEEATLDQKPVWIIRGRWNNRTALMLNALPGGAGAREGAPLPDYVPSAVSIWIGREDGWPYQVKLSGRRRTALEIDSDEPAKTAPAAAAKPPSAEDVPPTEILITYSNVSINAAIRPARFAFTAPNNEKVVDETAFYSQMLQRTLEQMSAQRKAEAAAAEAGSAPAADSGPSFKDAPTAPLDAPK